MVKQCTEILHVSQDHKANKEQRLIYSLWFYQPCYTNPNADSSFEKTPKGDKPADRLIKEREKRRHCWFSQSIKDNWHNITLHGIGRTQCMLISYLQHSRWSVLESTGQFSLSSYPGCVEAVAEEEWEECQLPWSESHTLCSSFFGLDQPIVTCPHSQW